MGGLSNDRKASEGEIDRTALMDGIKLFHCGVGQLTFIDLFRMMDLLVVPDVRAVACLT